MKVKLTKNKATIIDDEDFDLIQKYSWHACVGSNKKNYYARTHTKNKNGKYIKLGMHHLIMNCPDGFEIDHINGNGLDNKKANLRIVTRSQNVQNSKPHPHRKSQYIGVQYLKDIKKWRARITTNQKRIDLGCHASEIKAAKAYDQKAKELFGEHAKVNII